MYRSQQLARHCTSLLLMLPPGLVMHFVKQRSRTVCVAQDRGDRAVRGMRVSAARETRDARERATRRTVMNSCAHRGERAAGLLSVLAAAQSDAAHALRCARVRQGRACRYCWLISAFTCTTRAQRKPPEAGAKNHTAQGAKPSTRDAPAP
jgi:hypothetical protein